MRSSTRTFKQLHISVPGSRDAKDWTEKLFTSAKTADAALLVMAFMLCGWLLYCLARPFSYYQWMF